jgi:hypothetical protein
MRTRDRNTLRIRPAEHTFTRLTNNPTDLPTTALQLLRTKLKT